MADYSRYDYDPADSLRVEISQLKKELQEYRDKELAAELGESDFTQSDLHKGFIECLLCGSIVNVNRRSKHRERCIK